jgi:hypothetical protein
MSAVGGLSLSPRLSRCALRKLSWALNRHAASPNLLNAKVVLSVATADLHRDVGGHVVIVGAGLDLGAVGTLIGSLRRDVGGPRPGR